VKVDPYRQTLYFASSVPETVQKGMRDAASLFWCQFIQNNLNETWNSVLRSIVELKGQQSLENLHRRIQAEGWSWNNKQSLDLSEIKHRFSGRCVIGKLHQMGKGTGKIIVNLIDKREKKHK